MKTSRHNLLGLVLLLGSCAASHAADYALLQPAVFAHHVERFNAMEDETVVNAIRNQDAWDWFCLDGIKYHGHLLTVVWDETGRRYNGGAGLRLLADGKLVARTDRLERLTAELP